MDSWDAIGHVAGDKIEKITQTEEHGSRDAGLQGERNWVNLGKESKTQGSCMGFAEGLRAIVSDGNRDTLGSKEEQQKLSWSARKSCMKKGYPVLEPHVTLSKPNSDSMSIFI